MAKWKSTTEKPKRTGRFLYFTEDEIKKITVTDWNFDKHPSGYLFRAYIIKEDEEEVDHDAEGNPASDMAWRCLIRR